MTKLFQIYEDDLADLERTIPNICWSLAPHLTGTDRTSFRRVQEILSRVRWGYGPPEQVEVIPAGDD